MKIGLVVQRYGLEVSGGAEYLARMCAEHLAREHEIEVFTTCAQDYVFWHNSYPKGDTRINGVPVHRFKVRQPRNMRRFMDIQNLVFYESSEAEHQERWITENGPVCPDLIEAVSQAGHIECFFMFSYRYWTTVHALRAVPKKTILVPTAEHDPAVHLAVFKALFKMPAAFYYNTPEEKQLIEQVAQNAAIPNQVVGISLPEESQMDGFEHQYQDLDPYVIYVGRIDKNKGCDHLFRHFKRFSALESRPMRLVLAGHAELQIPEHPLIIYKGRITDSEKRAAIVQSRALIMPSAFESLSIVLLEAWKLKRPVLVNGHCAVLKGQSLRSKGGLPYHSYEEFAELLKMLMDHPAIGDRIGDQGYRYYQDNYRWDILRRKIEWLISQTVRKSAE